MRAHCTGDRTVARKAAPDWITMLWGQQESCSIPLAPPLVSCSKSVIETQLYLGEQERSARDSL